jgi:diguanylate cyclase (GGDEF)-like protein
MNLPSDREGADDARELGLLQRLARLQGGGGFEWHPQGGELLASREVRRRHRFADTQPFTLEALAQAYDEESRERLQAALSAAAEGQAGETVLELRREAADGGEPAIVHWTLHVEQRDGKPWRITGLARERSGVEALRDGGPALTDLLTGLANRRGLQARAAHAIAAAQRNGRALALLFIDLDHFKQVNDTLGHHAGDEMLRETARRLRTCVRGSDIVARQSGDEFIVVLSEVQRPQDAALVAHKILDALHEPVAIGSQQASVACSIGIALLSESCPDLERLTRAADTAMYAAKDAGRSTFRFYNDTYFLRLQRRAELEQELRHALPREQLFLVYQPSLRLLDGRAAGVEALLRWRAPDGGLRPPAEFLPLAEENGEIVAIGQWVLREACNQARRWREQGLSFERLVVNVSAAQLRDPAFPEQVAEICRSTDWPAERLELDLSDAALLQDREAGRRALTALRGFEVNLALDDFGTGLSNLINLHRFQIRTLKLDRHFALGMQDDPALQEVVEAVIAMGHALNMRMVAKGVETAYAADFLTERGCDEAQGFHFARPMPAADVPLWMQARDLAQFALLR